MAEVKHITMTCPQPLCDGQAFVQVLVVDDLAKQAKIDALARSKLIKELKRLHKEGLHD